MLWIQLTNSVSISDRTDLLRLVDDIPEGFYLEIRALESAEQKSD